MALVVVARALVVRLAGGAVFALDTIVVAGTHRLVTTLELNGKLGLRLGDSREGQQIQGTQRDGAETDQKLFHYSYCFKRLKQSVDSQDYMSTIVGSVGTGMTVLPSQAIWQRTFVNFGVQLWRRT